MGLSYVERNVGYTDATYVSTLDAGDFDILAGDLIVAVVTWRTSATADEPSVAQTDGTTNALTASDLYANGDVKVRIFYKLAATASSAATFRATFGATRQYASLTVYQYRPGSGEAAQVESAFASYGATATAIASGSLSSDQASVVFAGAMSAGAATFSAEEVNDTAATYYNRFTRADHWSRECSESLVSDVAEATQSVSQRYACGAMAFSVYVTGGASAVAKILLAHGGR